MYKIHYDAKNKNIIDVISESTGEVITPKYSNLSNTEDYVSSGVFPIEPMTAKEYLNEEELENMLTSDLYFAEEKLDGTRGLLYARESGGRIFSRRISKKTGYYCENSDSLPHLRDFTFSHRRPTVLDGEMFIPNQTFKEVSSTLNCNWDRAIERQEQYGLVHFNAFDIIYYKGFYIGDFPLLTRKRYLEEYLNEVKCPYINLVPYFNKSITVSLSKEELNKLLNISGFEVLYPNLSKAIKWNNPYSLPYVLDKKSYYEYIIATGGEGIMLKSIYGEYKQKRGREYTKYKKHLTRECVILDFTDPSIWYEGQELNNPSAIWNYWADAEDESSVLEKEMTMREAEEKGMLPCTKHWCKGWIGKIVFGVLATEEEIQKYEKVNNKKPSLYVLKGFDKEFIVVGECEGYNEEQRENFTKNTDKYIGSTVEIECNEVFKNTGKLRHPRFLRLRPDKAPQVCTWKDHIGG